MKNLLFSTTVCIVLSSCAAPKAFYQVHTTQAEDGIKVENSIMIFENEDLVITYDFWGELGDASFSVFNKTEKNIFLDLGNSHFVINGFAETYFQNRSFSVSSTGMHSYSQQTTRGSILNTQNLYSSKSSGSINTNASKSVVSSSSGVTQYEQRIVCVPPQTSKFIKGFSITESLVRNCDLLRYPTKEKQIVTLNFTEADSPIKLQNIISYGFQELDQSEFMQISNAFWVKEVTNYPSDKFFYFDFPEYCDEKSTASQKYFKYRSGLRYYIRYVKNVGASFKH